MAILEREVEVNLTSSNISHYEGLGYHIPRVTKNYKTTVPKGTKIVVSVDDLPKAVKTEVTKVCDICGVKSRQYHCTIVYSRGKTDGLDRCFTCAVKYRSEARRINVKYENSAEYHCANNKELAFLPSLFSDKNNKELSKVAKKSHDKFIWNCSKYGSSHEHTSSMANKLKNAVNNTEGCPYCIGRKVNETNSIATTHPHVAKLLWNEEDAHLYTAYANRKVDFKCLDCNHRIKNKYIYTVTQIGFSCPKCSDGVSYPEKFILNVLEQAGLDFETQVVFEWSENKRYDFYSESLDCIIEAHGAQHYGRGGFISVGGKTHEEELINDEYKKSLACDNNKVYNYIVIDSKISELNYMKESIMSSELADLIDLSLVDFNKCDEIAQKTIVKTACELWNEGLEVNEISVSLKSHATTIRRHLRKGSEIGWCDYSTNNRRGTRRVVEVS